MSLVIYNTLTRKKEPFETLEPGVVRMYVCGPTVYDKAHIGHAMSSIVFDVIHRYLEHRGYQVRHVMNYTDVDDKVILRAQELGADPMKLSESYINEYDRHLSDFNILPFDVKPRVSREIEPIIRMIEGLIERDFAYQLNGDVYFSVDADEDYGKLSRRDRKQMLAGARLEIDERKRNPADFALWKAAKPGEPKWPSPWGPGRPGWHIECSAMSLTHLGKQIDIHGGGNDLIFPHHENEIAQTESLTGQPFARYWVHNGMMQLAGEDMSKSTGNVMPIEDFLSQYEPDVLRMLVLNAGYRKPLAYTKEAADAAAQALDRLRTALRPADPREDRGAASDDWEQLAEASQLARERFESVMDDDFNSAGALSEIFELVRIINRARDAGAQQQALDGAQAVLRELAGTLGLRLEPQVALGPVAEELIQVLLGVREELRNAEQWALADSIRDRLAELGVVLEDGASGTTWRLTPKG